MALELVVWLIITFAGLSGFVFGLMARQHYIFVLGCALLIGSGALLWSFNGLLLDHQVASVSDAGVISYTDVEVTMSNIGLMMLALAFVATGVLSMLAFDFVGSNQVRRNTYHY